LLNIKHDKLKVHSLIGRITIELMRKAFKAVKRNRGAAGIDKISIEMFEENLEMNLLSLMGEIKKGLYEPIPLKRVFIPKGKGALRPLGIPSVRCRIGQEVIRRLINSTFDSRFHPNSYGFRPGRNCHQAVKRVVDYARQGYRYVVDADIKGFFDNIPHHLIMESVAAKIADGKVLSLIERFLKSGVMEEGKFNPTTRGTPQGGVISPLLANIVLDHLDWHLEKRGYKVVRYADDFVILCKTLPQAERALNDAKELLTKMELELSPEKTHIRHYNDGFDFLGFSISARSVKIRQKSEEKFKTKIRDITQRSHNLELKVIEKLNQVIRGTVNYFYTNFSTVKSQFILLDQWIRRRIRMMKYKRMWHSDNRRLKNKHIRRMGLLSCVELGKARLLC
jgi:RNA-directed DNA polymerase